jgi:hypothetical protein
MKPVSVSFFCAAAVVLFAECDLLDPQSSDNTTSGQTRFEGDYFPLSPGLQWAYTSEGTTITETEITYASEQMFDDTVRNDTGQLETVTVRQSAGPVAFSLPSGIKQLYRLVQKDVVETDTVVSESYYEITAGGIYLRAIVMEGADVMDTLEITGGGLYVKTPLVAGDSWTYAPEFDWSRLMGPDFDGEVSSSTDGTMRVRGMKTVQVNGVSRRAVHVEYVNSMTLEITDSAMESVSRDSGTSDFYFIADTGIVYIGREGSGIDTVTSPMYTAYGENVSTSALSLDSFSASSVMLAKTAVSRTRTSRHCGPRPACPAEAIINRIKKAARLAGAAP